MSTTNLGSRVLGAGRASERLDADKRPVGRRRVRITGWRRVISPLALLVVWQLTHVFDLVSEEKLPPPTRVVSEAYSLITTHSAAYGTLQGALGASLQRMAIGFAVGAGAALLFAILAGLSRWGEETIDPLMQMLRTLPFLGLIPLFILWFGIGEETKIVLVALGVAFPLYLNVHSGIRTADERLVEASRALGFTRAERLWHVVLPGALPQTLVGLRQSLGLAWLALIVGETVNADAGIGYLINNAREFLRTDVVVVGLIVYAVLGLVTDALVRLLERRALRWRAR